MSPQPTVTSHPDLRRYEGAGRPQAGHYSSNIDLVAVGRVAGVALVGLRLH